jgi:carboxypeptidase C (cathepsin A)
MLSENGPVLYDKESQQFKLNDYSWNKNASILYIESPAGVGFSKINNSDFFLMIQYKQLV